MPSSTPSFWYRALRRLMSAALRVFYRQIEVTGLEHLDTGQPTIVASNHPNSIIDPLMIGVLESRRVAFCAQDGLFRIPGFGWLLRSVGAIPIQRRSDHGDGASNEQAFAACRATLSAGGVISLFPEGHTHDALRVEPLKTGVARIALDAERASGYTQGVRIVPVGLNFLVRQAFRSDAHVAFGPPLLASDYAELDRETPRLAVRKLTDDLQQAIERLTVHIHMEDDERLISQTTSIVAGIRSSVGLDKGGQSPSERTALVKRIVHAYQWYATANPERFADLRRRMEHYTEQRRALGLGGERPALQHRAETLVWSPDRSRAERLALYLLGAVPAFYGALNAVVPYLLLRGLVALIRPDLVRQAWFKLMVGAALYSGWFGLIGALVTARYGLGPGIMYAITIMPICLFTLRYLTELRLHRLHVTMLWRGLDADERLSDLRGERDRLEQDLREVRDHYLAEHPES